MDPSPGARGAVRDAPALAGRLRWLLALRLIVATIMLGATVAIQVRQGEGFLATPLRGLYLAAGIAYLVTITCAILLPRVRDLRRFGALQLAADLLLLSAVVVITGGVGSPFLLVYFLVIIGAAILFYRAGSLVAAAASAALYGIAVAAPLVPPVAGMVDREGAYAALSVAEIGYRHLLATFGFFLVAFLASHLTESLRRMGRELSEASASLAGLERRNELILQSIASGLVTTDLAGRIAYVNRAAERIVQIDAAAALGRPFGEIFSVEGPRQPWRAPDRLGPAPLRLDGRLAGGGEDSLLGMTFSPLLDEAGSVSGVICSFQDLTAIRRMEEQVRRSDRLAAVGELAAGMAHEIRNPLASLSGSIQLLSEGLQLQGEDRELLEIVRRESGRLNALITDFLQYASPRAPQLLDTDLGELARETATLLSQARGPGWRVAVEEEHPGCCRAQVDPKLFRQVFWNLALNGVEAMPRGGALRIGLAAGPGGEAVVTFADEGTGISAGDRSRIFTPFFSTKEGGTGLGLAVVHRIVEAHGGRIEVESPPGGGTLVRVAVPTAAAGAGEGRRALGAA